MKHARLSIMILMLLLVSGQTLLSANNQTRNTFRFVMTSESMSFRQVFDLVENNTEYRFFYQPGNFNDKQTTSVKYSGADVNELLSEIFSDTPYTYSIKDKDIVITNKSTTSNTSIANQFNGVKGVVVDVQGSPIIGATVIVKGTNSGAITGVDGSFDIPNVKQGTNLEISFLGYKNEIVTVPEDGKINITLQSEAISLDEVVVIGYGTSKKSDLTGSVGSVKMEEVNSVGITSVDRALQGQVAGVSVNNKTGQPGESMMIRIRGGNSISGGNEPLYVIDGLPIEGMSPTINPEDIVSMEILKDASSTAIYGSRGANGVVLITTKRGGNKKTIVSYNGYVGFQKLRKKADLLDKDEYINMVNTVSRNDGNGIAITPDQAIGLPNNDWQDLAYQTALMHNHQFSLSGGNETSSIYASLNYLNQEGIIKNSGFKRFGMRLNGDQKISNKFKLAANMSYNYGVTDYANSSADGYGAIAYTAVVMPPIDPIFDENGKYTIFKGTPWGGTNPVGMSENYYNHNIDSRLIANMALDYDIIEGLKFRVTAGTDLLSSSGNSYVPIGIAAGGSLDGNASKSKSNMYSIVNENILSYDKEFNNGHKLSAMGGVSFQTYDSDNLSGNASGFLRDIYLNHNLGVGSKPGNPSSGFTESQMVSFLARVNYNIKDRYLFTLTGRYDGSSKFGINNKFAFFPSGAIAWRISEESFMKDIEWIHNLKLRASVGQTGNQAINPYQTLARLGTNGPVLDDKQDIGFILSGMANNDLKWETTTQTDIGLDFSVLDNKLSLSADFYMKQTRNLLYNATLPPSSGYSSMVRNVGRIDNKGFEISLTSVNIDRTVKWTTNVNFSLNRSVVKDLGKDALGNTIERIDAPIGGGNWFPLFLGKSPFQLYGYKVDGIYQSKEEAIANGESNKQAGDYKYKNVNGDNIVNTEDKTIITNLEPKFTFGMTNQISYKGIELSFLIVGSFGNDIVNEFNKSYTVACGKWNIKRDAWNDMWSEDNRDAKYARASTDTKSNVSDGDPSSVWVENGSYLRFKDIRLSYTIPSKIFGNIKRKPNISVYVSGQNLITITSYSHYDPEASWTSSAVNGWDRGVYPSYKSYTFGAQINF